MVRKTNKTNTQHGKISTLSLAETPQIIVVLTPWLWFCLHLYSVSIFFLAILKFLSQFISPVFHVADVLSASTASYGLEGKCTASSSTSVSIYFFPFAVVACSFASIISFDHLSIFIHPHKFSTFYFAFSTTAKELQRKHCVQVLYCGGLNNLCFACGVWHLQALRCLMVSGYVCCASL